MRKVLLLTTLIGLLPVGLFAQQGDNNQQKALAFTHVTVIDATGSPAQPDMTVVVKGDRIEALGKTGELAVPRNARVVDATGKFLIPGLWDMHVHPSLGKSFLALFTANGVTGIRVMSDYPESGYHTWRKEISAGQLIGPRMVISSPFVGSKPDDFPDGDPEDEGRKIVRKVKAEGADFVKVYDFIPRDAYFAIADEAKKQGIPFAGHVPNSVRVAEASDAGQQSIEHISIVLWGCSSQEHLWMKVHEGQLRPEKHPWETYSEQKAARLFARFVKNSTWVCPTVLVCTNSAFRSVEDLANDPGLEYVPLSTVEAWHSRLDARAAAVAAMATDDMADTVSFLQKQLDVIDAMRGAGVGLLAGTDTPLKFCLPGFGLHEELVLFVKAGLSPMEALRTATYNPAKFIGKLDSMGTIEQGKIADLVLLEADPLRDISNTQKIAAVVVGGKLSDKSALQRMLAKVKASPECRYYIAANGKSLSPHHGLPAGMTYDDPNDTYTIHGAGRDIYDTRDQFRFAHKRLKGAGSITARIDRIEHLHNYSKAGLMIRETTAPDSAFAAVLVTPGSLVHLQYRSEAGKRVLSSQTTEDNIVLPHWVRLVRDGNTFEAQHSEDGKKWKALSSSQPAVVEVAMDDPVHVGLAVCSHCGSTIAAEAKMSQVLLGGDWRSGGQFTKSEDIGFEAWGKPEEKAIILPDE
jgi:imidazolonepropionase-like amidohydrolase